MVRLYRSIITSAASTFFAYTAYLIILGYSFTFDAQPGWGTLFDLGSFTIRFHMAFVYIPLLFLLGALFGVAYDYGLFRSLGIGVTSLLIYPWVRPVGPHPFTGTNLFEFAGDILFFLVAYSIIAAAEMVVRHRSELQTVLTPENIRIGTVAGTLHFSVALYVRNVVWGAQWDLQNTSDFALLIWIAIGLVLLMLVPTALLLQYRLVTPVVVVLLLFVTAVGNTLIGPSPRQSITPRLLTIYMVFWFVPLILGLLSGSTEYAIRTRGRTRS